MDAILARHEKSNVGRRNATNAELFLDLTSTASCSAVSTNVPALSPTMWNNWVEKAKDLATNIDQQLNEAVGADADPNGSATTTTAGGVAASSGLGSVSGGGLAAAFMGSSRIGGGGGGGGGIPDIHEDSNNADAWNDDFDFGDDDDDDNGNKAPTKVEAAPDETSPVAASPAPPEPTIVAESTDKPTPPDEKSPAPSVPSPVVTMDEAEPVTTPAEAGWDHDNVDDIALSNNNDDAEEVEPGQTQPGLVENVTQQTPAPEEDSDHESVEAAKRKEPSTPSPDSPTPAAPQLQPPDSVEPSSPRPVLAAASNLLSSLSTPATSVAATATTAESRDNPEQPEKLLPKTAANSARPSLISNLAHRAEGLVHRAEGLAHQAEGGVSSFFSAASHLGDHASIAAASATTIGTTEAAASTSARTNVAGAVSNLFSSALVSAGPSIVNATPDKQEMDDVDKDDAKVDGGWVEDEDDLDMTETEAADDPVVVEAVNKDEDLRQTESAVENQPPNNATVERTESTLTQEIAEPSAAAEERAAESQSTTEETTSFVSVSRPESVFAESTETSPLSSDAEKHDRQMVPSMEAASATLTAAPIASNIEDDPRYRKLEEQLRLREHQLTSKAQQLGELQLLMEAQENNYKQKLNDTREEAKKRIQRAKERCEAAEAKLLLKSTSGAEDSAKHEGIIKALREEGQALAMKQSAMEQAVRAAKAESRDLAEQLDDETHKKNQALEKITKIEAELKITKDALNAARKGESQAGKLESDLLNARSDAEMKANTILSLQQQIKELTSESKELKDEIESTRKAAAHEAQQEKSSLRREHKDLISDLETKLRTTEREAAVREDALRHEVAELRKRWQDAVRRADALSMDIQSSTAPLLRQLESMERQNRARAANWAELEGRLRSELEESVIQNENLAKDRSDFKVKLTRLERIVKERDEELASARKTVEDQVAKISKLESHLEKVEGEAEKRQGEYEKVERLANEGVARVRSEMTQTVMESEERYRGQIDKLEKDLHVEKEKRRQLESQVDQLLENAGGMLGASQIAPEAIQRESMPKKLRQSEGQAEILAGALGFDDTDDEEEEDEDDLDVDRHKGVVKSGAAERCGSSFAALEQLTSRLKTAEVELKSLRKSLRDSELTRESLVDELAETRHAKEKLPLFEAKVKELTLENREKELEIVGLRDDIAEVRELYRTQLNVLLEEKASNNMDAEARRRSSPAGIMNPAATAAATSTSNASDGTDFSPIKENVGPLAV